MNKLMHQVDVVGLPTNTGNPRKAPSQPLKARGQKQASSIRTLCRHYWPTRSQHFLVREKTAKKRPGSAGLS